MSGLHKFIYEMRPIKPPEKLSPLPLLQEKGKWYGKQGELNSAYIAIDPKQPDIYVRQGITQFLFNDKKEAEKALKLLIAYQDHIARHL